MKRLLFAFFLLATISMGVSAQGFIQRLAGEPENIEDVSMPEGAWYFQLVCEQDDLLLHCELLQDKEVLMASGDGNARLFIIQSSSEPVPEGQKGQRIFGIGITRGENKYADRMADHKGKLVLMSDLSDEEKADAASWWYIVPGNEDSPYVTIQNRDTKKFLTLGAKSDDQYNLVLSGNSSNTASQNWKLRLMPRKVF
jgi:hypothetical protein